MFKNPLSTKRDHELLAANLIAESCDDKLTSDLIKKILVKKLVSGLAIGAVVGTVIVAGEVIIKNLKDRDEED